MTPVSVASTDSTLVPGQHIDAALLEGLRQLGADFLILQRHEARQHLDDGHLHAVGTPDGGELHADGARADDHRRLGQLFLQDGFQVGDHLLAVHLPRRGREGAGAGGDDDVLGLQRFGRALCVGDGHLAGGASLAVPMWTSMLFFFIRKPRPCVSRSETWRLRLTATL